MRRRESVGCGLLAILPTLTALSLPLGRVVSQAQPQPLHVRELSPDDNKQVTNLRTVVFASHLTSPGSLYMQARKWEEAMADKTLVLVACADAGSDLAASMQSTEDSKQDKRPAGATMKGSNALPFDLRSIMSESPVVGTADMLLHPIDGCKFCYVTNVCTHPQARRRGVARRLMDEVDARASQMEVSALVLHVDESNAAAYNLYENIGFVLLRDLLGCVSDEMATTPAGAAASARVDAFEAAFNSPQFTGDDPTAKLPLLMIKGCRAPGELDPWAVQAAGSYAHYMAARAAGTQQGGAPSVSQGIAGGSEATRDPAPLAYESQDIGSGSEDTRDPAPLAPPSPPPSPPPPSPPPYESQGIAGGSEATRDPAPLAYPATAASDATRAQEGSGLTEAIDQITQSLEQLDDQITQSIDQLTQPGGATGPLPLNGPPSAMIDQLTQPGGATGPLPLNGPPSAIDQLTQPGGCQPPTTSQPLNAPKTDT